MIRHALRLVWNRKRGNALILLEIFCSFLVVFAVGTMAILGWSNYRRPLGFDYENVWKVDLSSSPHHDEVRMDEEAIQSLLREAASLGPVEAVSAAMFSPFEASSWRSSYENGNRVEEVDILPATPGLGDVLKMKTIRGRWFQPADAKLSWIPVVITQDVAESLFGQEDPVGRTIQEGSAEGSPGLGVEERRVIGVVRDFRRMGELSLPQPAAIELVEDMSQQHLGRLLVRVRPGTPAAFEAELVQRLRAVAHSGAFGIKASPLSEERDSALQWRLVPLLAGGILATFLLVMVALGLVGVLWQNLIRRTREIGLRRAVGASRGSLRWQLLAEQLVLTTFGVALAVLLAGQLPLTGVIGFIPPGVFVGGLALAAAAMYLLTALCALYPSWMASRIPPAEALRYE